MTDTPQNPFEDQPGGAVPPPPPGFTPPPPPPPSGGLPGNPAPPPGYVSYESRPPGPGNETLASPWRRIVARILDSLIVGVGLIVLALVIGVDGFNGSIGSGDIFVFQLIALVVSVGYEALFLASRGATLGKMALSVKVVYEDHRTLDMQGALMRLAITIGLGVAALVPVLGGLSQLVNFVVAIVSLVFLFTHDRRQTVWDRVGKTVVIAN